MHLHPCFSLWVKGRVLQPVEFLTERVTLDMVQDPIQHCSGKYRITHHLGPVNALFVGGKMELISYQPLESYWKQKMVDNYM